MNLATIFVLLFGAVLLDLVVGDAFEIDLGQQEGLFEGDIERPKRNRNGILAARRWPENKIYYKYGAKWNQNQIKMIEDAIKEIQDNTCIKFIKRTNQDNYVNIINGTGCYSAVGYNGDGMQPLSLKDRGCWYHKTIVHELLHTVGLWHEQSRYDRDNYISINIDNVDYCSRHNFDIEPGTSSNTYGVPYNYLSVMHYSKTAFSSNKAITITTTNPIYMNKIGKVERGNSTDYDKVNRIYQCGAYKNFMPPPAPATRTSLGSRKTASVCHNVDCDSACPSWAANGDCQSDSDFMNKNCLKSCKTCSKKATTTAPIKAATTTDPSSEDCVDNDTTNICAPWAKAGFCQATGYSKFMTENCAKTCELC